MVNLAVPATGQEQSIDVRSAMTDNQVLVGALTAALLSGGVVPAAVGVEALQSPQGQEIQLAEIALEQPGADHKLGRENAVKDLLGMTAQAAHRTDAAATGWSLRDADNHTVSLTDFESIAAGESLTIVRDGSPLSLNNSGDTIRLHGPNNSEVDKVNYDAVSEGEVVQRGL